MQMLRYFTLCLLFSIITVGTNAQMSGNRVYESGNSYNNNDDEARTLLRSTDTSLIISVRLLKNMPADLFSLTFALNFEASTVQLADKAINTKINTFILGLEGLGIDAANIYVDYIGLNKIYDFDVSDSKAEQIEKGFEIKSNIIITIKDFSLLNKIIALASENGIYDLVKADYYDTKSENTHKELFISAMELVNERKILYAKGFSEPITNKFRVIKEVYNTVSPKDCYKSYTAAESADVSNNSNSNSKWAKVLARKSKTFFYDAYGQSSFDKTSGIENPIVGIQYILELDVYFDLRKGK